METDDFITENCPSKWPKKLESVENKIRDIFIYRTLSKSSYPKRVRGIIVKLIDSFAPFAPPTNASAASVWTNGGSAVNSSLRKDSVKNSDVIAAAL